MFHPLLIISIIHSRRLIYSSNRNSPRDSTYSYARLVCSVKDRVHISKCSLPLPVSMISQEKKEINAL